MQVAVGREAVIEFPNGVIGFPELKEFFLEDAGDGGLILWLRSVQDKKICFPVLEPRMFQPQFQLKLSAVDLRELKLKDLADVAVFSILTIPQELAQMTANLKAPIVLNVREQVAKQVVLQDPELSLKHPMFRELRAHLATLQSGQKQPPAESAITGPVPIKELQTLRGPFAR